MPPVIQLEMHPWWTAIASLQVVVLPRYHLQQHCSSDVLWPSSSKQDYAAKVRSFGRGVDGVGEYWRDENAHAGRFVRGVRVVARFDAVN
jgi:hypothetical protein